MCICARVSENRIAMAQPATASHAQAFFVSIDYVSDVRSLLRLSLVSKTARGSCQAHVKQHLPALLDELHIASRKDNGKSSHGHQLYKVDVCDKSLLWLYRTAGPAAVGSPAAALAILRMVGPGTGMGIDCQIHLRRMAMQHGMQLTTEVLVAAAKEVTHACNWLNDRAWFPKWREEGQLPAIDVLPPLVIAVARHKMDVLTPLIPGITRQQMADLLLIAANSYDDPSTTTQALLQHDKQSTHVLHSLSSNSASSYHADSSLSPTQLVEQLLTTSIYRQHPSGALVKQLGGTDAAKTLSTSTMLKLLYLALHEEPRYYHMKYDPRILQDEKVLSTFGAVCSLPAVQAISTAHISSIMQIAWKRGMYGSVGWLTTLPQAQQLPSEILCKLLVSAITSIWTLRSSSLQALLQRLATLQAGQQLADGDAYKLLEAVLSLGSLRSNLLQIFNDLAPMQLGSQLTGSELLQLLTMAAGNNAACSALAALKPAADQIDDESGYTAFLELAIENCARRGGFGQDTNFNTLLQAVPLTQHLGPQSVVTLVAKCVSTETVYDFVFEIPALQQLSSIQVEQLLIHAARAGCMWNVKQLLAVPAAAQLSSATLHQLLQAVLEDWTERNGSCLNVQELQMLCQLLDLPAAGQLTVDAAANVIMQACGLLIKLEQTGLEYVPSAVQQALESCIAKLLQLSATQQTPYEMFVHHMLNAIAAGSVKQLLLFSKLPIADEISGSTAKHLVERALERGNLQVLQTMQECMPKIAAVAATMQPTGEQLKKQFAYAIAHQDQQALVVLCRHPVAAQISPSGMQELLQEMLESLALGHWHMGEAKQTLQDDNPVRLLFHTQAAQALGPSVVEELWECCRGRHGRQPNMVGISWTTQLPASAQVAVEPCESMLTHLIGHLKSLPKQTFNDVKGCALEAMSCLLQLPAMQALPVEAVGKHLQSAMPYYHRLGLVQGRAMMELIGSQLPSGQRLSTQHVKALMRIAVEVEDTCTFSWLKRLLATPMDEEVQAWEEFMRPMEFHY